VVTELPFLHLSVTSVTWFPRYCYYSKCTGSVEVIFCCLTLFLPCLIQILSQLWFLIV